MILDLQIWLNRKLIDCSGWLERKVRQLKNREQARYFKLDEQKHPEDWTDYRDNILPRMNALDERIREVIRKATSREGG